MKSLAPIIIRKLTRELSWCSARPERPYAYGIALSGAKHECGQTDCV